MKRTKIVPDDEIYKTCYNSQPAPTQRGGVTAPQREQKDNFLIMAPSEKGREQKLFPTTRYTNLVITPNRPNLQYI